MTLLKIALMGHPVLLTRAAPVADPREPDLRRLAEAMIATMLDADGAGLAAPQVHVSRRLIVACAPERDAPLVLANPELEPFADPAEDGWEGCLSIPGLRGVVPRAPRLRYRGQDLDGKLVTGEAEGFFARVLQHEVDHLDGVLYPMRMSDLGRLTFLSEMKHAAEKP